MTVRWEPTTEEADKFTLIAGAVCLDFANTVGGWRGRQAYEYLRTYSDLMRWARDAELFNADTVEDIMSAARERPAEAEAVLARAIVLREAIYRIFTSLLSRTPPTPQDLEILNIELAHAYAHLAIAYTPDGYAWQWYGEVTPDAVLWRVARSTADVLLSLVASMVRQCAGDICGWLFIDNTRNHSRRWCDMRGCGNRAKVRRHRARQRRPEAPV